MNRMELNYPQLDSWVAKFPVFDLPLDNKRNPFYPPNPK